MLKYITTMNGVTEYTEKLPVEIYNLDNKFVIRATNECSNNEVLIDLGNVIEWINNNVTIERKITISTEETI